MKLHYLYLFGSIISKSLLDKVIKSLEKQGIWMALIPCKIILDTKQIDSAATLAIRDFVQNMQKARKINIQFLLRFLGERQIMEAFHKLSEINDNDYCFVVFYDPTLSKNEVVKILEEYCAKQNCINNLSDNYNCRPDIDTIMRIYDINHSEIEAVSRNNTPMREKFIKIILERIALSFLR